MIAPDSGVVDVPMPTEIKVADGNATLKSYLKVYDAFSKNPQVAWIPKGLGVTSSLSPVANVVSMIYVYGVDWLDIEEIALGALKEVGITEEAFTESSKLGAKALRANFAYHLIRRVKLWVFDEYYDWLKTMCSWLSEHLEVTWFERFVRERTKFNETVVILTDEQAFPDSKVYLLE